MKPTRTLLALFLGATLSFTAAHAQDKPADSAQPEKMSARPHSELHQWEEQLHTTDCHKMPTRTLQSDCAEAHAQRYVIYLQNMATQNDANEILVALRNLFDPSMKVFLSTNQNAIAITTYPEEFERMEALVKKLDIPHPTYRVTFTLAEIDGGKQIGVQHYTLITALGQRVIMKQGSKVPVITGSYKEAGNGTQQQFTYLDIGMNIDATINKVGNGLQMKVKVEQSSVANESEIGGVREPIVRQSVFDGVPSVKLGQATAIGQMDVPGSTRHLDIDVLVESM